MVLLLVFLMTMLGLFALFLGGGLVAQGYLYQNPAERMTIRALAGALLVAGFLTLWVGIDRRAPGRYDTLFNFAGTSTVEFDEFEAVRWMGANKKLLTDANGNYLETTAKFTRSAGGKGANFVEEGTNNKFDPVSGSYMTAAIRVKGPNDPGPVRYNAVLDPDSPKASPTYSREQRRFVEENGSRYVEMSQPGTLFVPSTRTVALSLLLNFAMVLVWLAAFWPILRFSLAHALIFTGAFAVITLIAVMPVLFRQNRAEPKSEPAPTAVLSRAVPTEPGG